MKRPDLARELDERMRRDQQTRRWAQQSKLPEDGESVKAVDRDNTAWLNTVVNAHGWPGVDLVGEDGAEAAWLIAQHADHHPQFQQRALELITHAALAGDVPGRHYAYLTDRRRVACARPQVYGTQYERDADGAAIQLCMVEDPDRLDERREGVGLEPQKDYERRILPHY